jgi:hypothetical protein
MRARPIFFDGRQQKVGTMTANRRSRLLGYCVSTTALLLLAATASAADHGRAGKKGAYNPSDRTVEMFEAIKKGDISVKLIPKDSTQCRVLIENKTDQPLNVKLPDSFAGVPALAQGGLGGAGGGRSGRSSSSNGGGQNQSMGGGMGGGGGGGMGGGMGMFNVPPEKVGQLKVTTVCLEHGKEEPRAAIPYEIQPLNRVTTRSGVRELCESLGRGETNQRAAQAAAWHLNNDMSWDQLAAKRIKHANGTSEPYFTQQELQAAMKITNVAIDRAAERRQQEEATSDGSGSHY